MPRKRIQMKPDAASGEIIAPNGKRLGRFIAGHGYWVTTQNQATVDKVLADGRAVEVDPSTAPRIGAGPGSIKGSVKVGG